MKSLILASYALLVGCGGDVLHRRGNVLHIRGNVIVDLNGFDAYVDVFKDQAMSRGQQIVISDLIIEFADIPSPEGKRILGRCWHGASTPRIEIDVDSWNTSSMVRRWNVIAHELGHCVLRRAHDDSELSIMNTYILSNSTYTENEEYLITELFDRSKYDSLNLSGGTDCDGLHWGDK